SVKRLTIDQNSDDLSPGVNEFVKVYVAQLRKISEGDKIAGRHGNKGVVSKILPVEDMPYLPDGTPVDVVLSPLGVPSRMHLGQVIATVMGFVAVHNGWKVWTAGVAGAKEQHISVGVKGLSAGDYAEDAEDGGITIYDGRTDEPM